MSTFTKHNNYEIPSEGDLVWGTPIDANVNLIERGITKHYLNNYKETAKLAKNSLLVKAKKWLRNAASTAIVQVCGVIGSQSF